LNWDTQAADYVRGRISIFREIFNIIGMILLIVAGIWDLIKKEIPVVLLGGLTVVAFFIYCEAGFVNQVAKIVISIQLGLSGALLMHSKKIGGGDVWMLICLAVMWPMDEFWKSLCSAVILLCTTAMGVWWMTGDENIQIPMVPFLVLGYWM